LGSLTLFRPLSASPSSRKLVIIQLNGGNDGFNTIVPYNSDWYYQARPTIAVPRQNILPLNTELGLPVEMRGLYDLYRKGSLAIFPSVGYANMSRSHFRSTDIWHTAASDRIEETGWIGRLLQERDDGTKVGWAVGEPVLPKLLHGAPQSLMLDATTIGEKLNVVLQGIQSKRADVYFLSMDGFDTHADQLATHRLRLEELSTGLLAFQRVLERAGWDDQVCTLVFSEFGRKLNENADGGTDHGDGGPLFILGKCVHGAVYDSGTIRSGAGDRSVALDYRFVYAQLLQDWFACKTNTVVPVEYAGQLSVRALTS
jgi:uncharacterized protein (DUF1501 family)